MLEFRAKFVSEKDVIGMLYKLEPTGSYVERYGEIAAAIVKASNSDPLFPQHEAGAEATACILVAIAWHETKFHPNLIGGRGKAFGLYQIYPPVAGPKIKGNMLLSATTASLVIVDLVRTSFRQCADRHWVERLAWLFASNGETNMMNILRKSMERLLLAQTLFSKFFPAREIPPQVPMLTETVEACPGVG